MKILLSLIVIAIMGCGEPRNNFVMLVTVNNESSDQLKLTLETLTAEVNEALRCDVIAPLKSNGKRRVIELKYDDVRLKEMSEPNTSTLGAYLDNRFVPYANEEIIFQSTLASQFRGLRLHGVMLHELGHALGLEHEEGSIMSEQYDRAYNKTSAQMESFKSLIQKYGLNPCDIPGYSSPVN